LQRLQAELFAQAVNGARGKKADRKKTTLGMMNFGPIFRILDQDGDGSIGIRDLRNGLDWLGIGLTLSPSDCKKVLKALDPSKSSKANLKQICHFALRERYWAGPSQKAHKKAELEAIHTERSTGSKSLDKALRTLQDSICKIATIKPGVYDFLKAFEKLDRNGSGNLNVAELQDILLSSHGAATSDPAAIPPQLVRRVLQYIDRDCDGVINFAELEYFVLHCNFDGTLDKTKKKKVSATDDEANKAKQLAIEAGEESVELVGKETWGFERALKQGAVPASTTVLPLTQSPFTLVCAFRTGGGWRSQQGGGVLVSQGPQSVLQLLAEAEAKEGGGKRKGGAKKKGGADVGANDSAAAESKAKTAKDLAVTKKLQAAITARYKQPAQQSELLDFLRAQQQSMRLGGGYQPALDPSLPLSSGGAGANAAGVGADVHRLQYGGAGSLGEGAVSEGRFLRILRALDLQWREEEAADVVEEEVVSLLEINLSGGTKKVLHQPGRRPDRKGGSSAQRVVDFAHFCFLATSCVQKQAATLKASANKGKAAAAAAAGWGDGINRDGPKRVHVKRTTAQMKLQRWLLQCCGADRKRQRLLLRQLFRLMRQEADAMPTSTRTRLAGCMPRERFVLWLWLWVWLQVHVESEYGERLNMNCGRLPVLAAKIAGVVVPAGTYAKEFMKPPRSRRKAKRRRGSVVASDEDDCDDDYSDEEDHAGINKGESGKRGEDKKEEGKGGGDEERGKEEGKRVDEDNDADAAEELRQLLRSGVGLDSSCSPSHRESIATVVVQRCEYLRKEIEQAAKARGGGGEGEPKDGWDGMQAWKVVARRRETLEALCKCLELPPTLILHRVTAQVCSAERVVESMAMGKRIVQEKPVEPATEEEKVNEDAAGLEGASTTKNGGKSRWGFGKTAAKSIDKEGGGAAAVPAGTGHALHGGWVEGLGRAGLAQMTAGRRGRLRVDMQVGPQMQRTGAVRFSNRPVWVEEAQTIDESHASLFDFVSLSPPAVATFTLQLVNAATGASSSGSGSTGEVGLSSVSLPLAKIWDLKPRPKPSEAQKHKDDANKQSHERPPPPPEFHQVSLPLSRSISRPAPPLVAGKKVLPPPRPVVMDAGDLKIWLRARTVMLTGEAATQAVEDGLGKAEEAVGGVEDGGGIVKLMDLHLLEAMTRQVFEENLGWRCLYVDDDGFVNFEVGKGVRPLFKKRKVKQQQKKKHKRKTKRQAGSVSSGAKSGEVEMEAAEKGEIDLVSVAGVARAGKRVTIKPSSGAKTAQYDTRWETDNFDIGDSSEEGEGQSEAAKAAAKADDALDDHESLIRISSKKDEGAKQNVRVDDGKWHTVTLVYTNERVLPSRWWEKGHTGLADADIMTDSEDSTSDDENSSSSSSSSSDSDHRRRGRSRRKRSKSSEKKKERRSRSRSRSKARRKKKRKEEKRRRKKMAEEEQKRKEEEKLRRKREKRDEERRHEEEKEQNEARKLLQLKKDLQMKAEKRRKKRREEEERRAEEAEEEERRRKEAEVRRKQRQQKKAARRHNAVCNACGQNICHTACAERSEEEEDEENRIKEAEERKIRRRIRKRKEAEAEEERLEAKAARKAEREEEKQQKEELARQERRLQRKQEKAVKKKRAARERDDDEEEEAEEVAQASSRPSWRPRISMFRRKRPSGKELLEEKEEEEDGSRSSDGDSDHGGSRSRASGRGRSRGGHRSRSGSRSRSRSRSRSKGRDRHRSGGDDDGDSYSSSGGDSGSSVDSDGSRSGRKKLEKIKLTAKEKERAANVRLVKEEAEKRTKELVKLEQKARKTRKEAKKQQHRFKLYIDGVLVAECDRMHPGLDMAGLGIGLDPDDNPEKFKPFHTLRVGCGEPPPEWAKPAAKPKPTGPGLWAEQCGVLSVNAEGGYPCIRTIGKSAGGGSSGGGADRCHTFLRGEVRETSFVRRALGKDEVPGAVKSVRALQKLQALLAVAGEGDRSLFVGDDGGKVEGDLMRPFGFTLFEMCRECDVKYKRQIELELDRQHQQGGGLRARAKSAAVVRAKVEQMPTTISVEQFTHCVQRYHEGVWGPSVADDYNDKGKAARHEETWLSVNDVHEMSGLQPYPSSNGFTPDEGMSAVKIDYLELIALAGGELPQDCTNTGAEDGDDVFGQGRERRWAAVAPHTELTPTDEVALREGRDFRRLRKYETDEDEDDEDERAEDDKQVTGMYWQPKSRRQKRRELRQQQEREEAEKEAEKKRQEVRRRKRVRERRERERRGLSVSDLEDTEDEDENDGWGKRGRDGRKNKKRDEDGRGWKMDPYTASRFTLGGGELNPSFAGKLQEEGGDKSADTRLHQREQSTNKLWDMEQRLRALASSEARHRQMWARMRHWLDTELPDLEAEAIAAGRVPTEPCDLRALFERFEGRAASRQGRELNGKLEREDWLRQARDMRREKTKVRMGDNSSLSVVAAGDRDYDRAPFDTHTDPEGLVGRGVSAREMYAEDDDGSEDEAFSVFGTADPDEAFQHLRRTLGMNAARGGAPAGRGGVDGRCINAEGGSRRVGVVLAAEFERVLAVIGLQLLPTERRMLLRELEPVSQTHDIGRKGKRWGESSKRNAWSTADDESLVDYLRFCERVDAMEAIARRVGEQWRRHQLDEANDAIDEQHGRRGRDRQEDEADWERQQEWRQRQHYWQQLQQQHDDGTHGLTISEGEGESGTTVVLHREAVAMQGLTRHFERYDQERSGVVKLKHLRSACARCGCKLTNDEKQTVGRRFRVRQQCASKEAIIVSNTRETPLRSKQDPDESNEEDENQVLVDYRQFLFYVLRRNHK
jgi:Ca2+-binding EF-hand superfamily protein